MNTREKLIKQIEAYIPVCEQEAADRIEILRHLRGSENIFLRENAAAHVTVSGWVVNKDRTKVLMVYHNIYNSWSWLGGHADGEEELIKVALKEVSEESGLTSLRPVSEEIYSMEILTVNGHVKKGKYVSSHLHLNFTYLIEADENEPLRIKEDENSGVAWFGLEEAIEASTETWFKERIYPKLNAGLGEAR